MIIFLGKQSTTFIHHTKTWIMKFLFALLLVPFLIIPAYAETQTLPTEQGTLDVKLTYDPIEPDMLTKMNIDFINPQTQKIQIHIDYSVAVSKDGETVFGPTNLIHTSEGSVKIPIEFKLGEGVYSLDIEVEGILFNPIPPETVSFDILVGEASIKPITPPNDEDECIIATASFGSPMANEVQMLREIRDNQLLQTESGSAFMGGFNTFYYSFAPTVAGWEHENPVFKEVVKTVITPLITSLSLLNYVSMNSEEEVLTYGISLIILNIGMYVGIPAFGILKLYQFKRN